MTTTELCKELKRRLRRNVYSAELRPIAEQLGKTKVIARARSAKGTYVWDERDIDKVVEML